MCGQAIKPVRPPKWHKMNFKTKFFRSRYWRPARPGATALFFHSFLTAEDKNWTVSAEARHY
jgi:hypothetical protein